MNKSNKTNLCSNMLFFRICTNKATRLCWLTVALSAVSHRESQENLPNSYLDVNRFLFITIYPSKQGIWKYFKYMLILISGCEYLKSSPGQRCSILGGKATFKQSTVLPPKGFWGSWSCSFMDSTVVFWCKFYLRIQIHN